jgi:hypothetical protein
VVFIVNTLRGFTSGPQGYIWFVPLNRRRYLLRSPYLLHFRFSPTLFNLCKRNNTLKELKKRQIKVDNMISVYLTLKVEATSLLILLLISIYIATSSSEQLHCIDQKEIQKCLDVPCTLVHTKYSAIYLPFTRRCGKQISNVTYVN